MNKSLICLLLSFPLMFWMGCGAASQSDWMVAASKASPSESAADFDGADMAPRFAGQESEAAGGEFGGTRSLATNETSGESMESQIPEAESNFQRQIIYTARLSIQVDDFEPLPDQISQLAERMGGYISQTNVGRMQGTRRSGSWTLRVPVKNYREFLRSASGLGVPESLTENAQDVTEEFVDLDARLASSRKLEEQVMKLLEKQTDKIDDLISIERELSRVRLEIERMEGRIRYLKNQVGMSTVFLTATEVRTFVPEEQPSLDRRVTVEWQEALGRTQRFLEETVLYLVANSIAIVAGLIVLIVVWLPVRRWLKRLRRPTDS